MHNSTRYLAIVLYTCIILLMNTYYKILWSYKCLTVIDVFESYNDFNCKVIRIGVWMLIGAVGDFSDTSINIAERKSISWTFTGT